MQACARQAAFKHARGNRGNGCWIWHGRGLQRQRAPSKWEKFRLWWWPSDWLDGSRRFKLGRTHAHKAKVSKRAWSNTGLVAVGAAYRRSIKHASQRKARTRRRVFTGFEPDQKAWEASEILCGHEAGLRVGQQSIRVDCNTGTGREKRSGRMGGAAAPWSQS